MASLLGLTGCAALDRYFEIEKSDYAKEVLIFGAGVSGLSTAYFLKKNNVPYRIFEASNRIGGRVLSQRLPLPVAGAIDMGARYVDVLDQDIIDLTKEMNLDLEQAPVQKNSYFFFFNKEFVSYKALLKSYAVTIKSWNKEQAQVRKLSDDLDRYSTQSRSLSDLMAYDKISFAEILNDSKLDPKGRAIFKNWAEIHFQKKVADVSFLEWLYHLERLTLSSKKMYLPGGMTQFIDILGQRVSGVIPNYNMQVGTKLVEINRSKDKWICHIQTKEGLKKLSSPFVVLALPFNQLKFIKGIENVFTNKGFKEAIFKAEFKSHHRIVFKSFQKSLKENGSYFFFESNKFQVTKEDSLYTLDLEQGIDASTFMVIKNQIAQLFGVKDLEEINLYSWSQIPQINGSELKLVSNTLIPIKTAYLDNWERMSLQIVGDYLFSPDRPNLNDCVKSAMQASKNITTLALEKELI